MSRVARTNKWLQHSRSLLALDELSQDGHQREAVAVGVVFAIEKALVSLVYEILESNETAITAFNIDCILSNTDESVTEHWLIKQIKEHRQLPHHWLNQWWLSRISMGEITSCVAASLPSDDQANNINLIAVHPESEFAGWVEECHQLIVDARALNSYE